MIRGTRFAEPLPPASPAAYYAHRPVPSEAASASGSKGGPDDLAVPAGQLERNAIGLTEVLFQSITFMAPAVAVALSIGFATTFALGLTPLAVVFALIAVLFTAFSMGELARHLPSAGGMYTYVGRGLGSYAGWLLAWAFLLASIVVPSVLFAAFGFFGAALITELTGLRAGIPVDPAGPDLCAGHRLVPDLSRDLDLDARPASPSA